VDLEPRFTEDQIRTAVRELAARISADYHDRRPVLVGILKGSFVFVADLLRELTIPAAVEVIRARSYRGGRRSSGSVEITLDVETDLRGRHVIVVEDIADTGRTMAVVVARIHAAAPASVAGCALLVREGSAPPEYSGLTVGPGFVVGYGMDHAEEFRGLRDIRAVDGAG
jgi:hypoxanthine phosphoribosyltransferase